MLVGVLAGCRLLSQAADFGFLTCESSSAPSTGDLHVSPRCSSDQQGTTAGPRSARAGSLQGGSALCAALVGGGVRGRLRSVLGPAGCVTSDGSHRRGMGGVWEGCVIAITPRSCQQWKRWTTEGCGGAAAAGQAKFVSGSFV